MSEKKKQDVVFDALLQAAASDAFEAEMRALPSEEALNERYGNTDRLDENISRMIQSYDKKRKHRVYLKYAGKAAAFVCAFLLVTTAVMMSVEATRTKIVTAVVEWTEDYTQLRFGDKSTSSDAVHCPTYLPEGYEEISCEPLGDGYVIIYENDEGTVINLLETSGDGPTVSVDNDDLQYRDTMVNENHAYLFESANEDENSILLWETDDMFFDLSAPLSTDELIQIAESIK